MKKIIVNALVCLSIVAVIFGTIVAGHLMEIKPSSYYEMDLEFHITEHQTFISELKTKYNLSGEELERRIENETYIVTDRFLIEEDSYLILEYRGSRYFQINKKSGFYNIIYVQPFNETINSLMDETIYNIFISYIYYIGFANYKKNSLDSMMNIGNKLGELIIASNAAYQFANGSCVLSIDKDSIKVRVW